jgi:hypothetical protein
VTLGPAGAGLYDALSPDRLGEGRDKRRQYNVFHLGKIDLEDEDRFDPGSIARKAKEDYGA